MKAIHEFNKMYRSREAVINRNPSPKHKFTNKITDCKDSDDLKQSLDLSPVSNLSPNFIQSYALPGNPMMPDLDMYDDLSHMELLFDFSDP